MRKPTKAELAVAQVYSDFEQTGGFTNDGFWIGLSSDLMSRIAGFSIRKDGCIHEGPWSPEVDFDQTFWQDKAEAEAFLAQLKAGSDE